MLIHTTVYRLSRVIAVALAFLFLIRLYSRPFAVSFSSSLLIRAALLYWCVFSRGDAAVVRTICCAVVALLVLSDALFAQTRVVGLRTGARHSSRVVFVHRFARCPPVFIPYTIAV